MKRQYKIKIVEIITHVRGNEETRTQEEVASKSFTTTRPIIEWAFIALCKMVAKLEARRCISSYSSSSETESRWYKVLSGDM